MAGVAAAVSPTQCCREFDVGTLYSLHTPTS